MAQKETKEINSGDNSNNVQASIVVRGDYIVGLNTQQVIELIKDYCAPNKDEIVAIVQEAIESIDKNKRTAPDKRIFVPAIQQLSYSTDNEIIKNVYQKLLRSSINIDEGNKVHPSFVSIIAQLNSDEVKILNELGPLANIPQPLINLRIKINNQPGLGITQVSNFSDIGYGICDNPGEICAYLENLERLKLIEIPSDRHLIREGIYNRLKNHPAILAVISKNPSTETIKIKHEFDEKYFHLTRFGQLFVECCIK